ncbi:MAG TPA: hypothetical protein VIN10_02825 [Bacteroidales bacterium]
MKTLVAFLIGIFTLNTITSQDLKVQDSIKVQNTSTVQDTLFDFTEDAILINGVPVNVGNIILPGDLDQVKSLFQSFIKEQLKEKMKEDDGVLILEENVVNQVTEKRGDLLAYIYNQNDKVSLNVGYKLGYDVYLNSAQYPVEFNRLKDFINYFTYYYYSEYLPGYIKEQSKNLKVLKKENSSAEKSIKSATKENKKLTKAINKNKKELIDYDTKISSATEQEAKTTLTTKQKEINKEIADNQTTIDNNTKLIEAKQARITNLKPQIESVTANINTSQLTLIEVRSKAKTFHSIGK